MTNAELQELGLPDIFLAIGDGTAPPNVRSSLWPTSGFLQKLPALAQAFPPAADYVPLYALPASGVVAFDRRRRVYVRYYLGDTTDEVIAGDYEELCALISIEMIEDGLDEELDEIAPLFRFEHIAELKAYTEEHTEGTAEGMTREFMKTIR